MPWTFYKFFLIFGALTLVSVSCNKPPAPNIYSQKIIVGNKNVFVEIVKTEADMATGLSNRKSLPENSGMLFDFSGNAEINKKNQTDAGMMPTFWMKDMEFNIDIIWIYKNKIIGITSDVPAPAYENLSAPDALPTYTPPSGIDFVLEVNSGWSKKNNIKTGDNVEMRN